MKDYFKRSSRASAFYPADGGPPGGPGGPPDAFYSIRTHAAAVAALGLEGGREQQLATLNAIREIVEREKQEYQQEIQRNSRRSYCVVCEKAGET